MSERYAAEPSERQDATVAWICYGLYLFGVTNGLTIIVGLIVAYAHIGKAGPMLRTHFDFLIRTVWLALAWLIIGGLLSVLAFVFGITIIGIPIAVILGLFAIVIFSVGTIWFVLRMIVGMIFLARGEAHPRPQTWFF